VTDRERYQELLSLLSHGLIRWAEKHGFLGDPAEISEKVEVVGSAREEAATHD
jgi:hypothetical protein